MDRHPTTVAGTDQPPALRAEEVRPRGRSPVAKRNPQPAAQKARSAPAKSTRYPTRALSRPIRNTTRHNLRFDPLGLQGLFPPPAAPGAFRASYFVSVESGGSLDSTCIL